MNRRHPHRFSSNPNSLKSRFTKRFIRSLLKINRQTPNDIHNISISQRWRRVRTAANKSLAFAVGTRRAWSRAMICKIQNRARNRRLLGRRVSVKRIKNQSKIKRKKIVKNQEGGGFDQTCMLRKLVPGGEGMELCSLLGEAAHYIKCLNTQVQVMKSIADLYSN
ncbi:transcription factor IBH1-like [Mercurialis annua]|uniref:transcription factor IBH1-like n=1 Tax=Mercurialis annua TaxID=3986 RepID=UPI002160F4D6|nr:transcription factor IBH1-like [Mercurialis annua]